MTLTIVLMSLLVLLVGLLLAATPRLMPPTECFAVTVPPSAQQDPRIRGYKRTYALLIIGISAFCALGQALYLLRIMGDGSVSEEVTLKASFVISAATLVPIVAGFALMLAYRSRVRALKQAEGWKALAQQATTIIGEEVPKPISLAWDLLFVVPVLAMTVFALAMYDRFPDQIPMNSDFSGNTTTYVPKSLGSVLFPAIVVGYMGLIFTLCHWFTIISKRPTDPAAPATSALAYGRFARTQSQLMLAGGLLISAAIGCAFYLSALQIVSLGAAATITMVTVTLFVAVMAIIALKMGQSGARLAAELRESDTLARDDDSFWALGTFYFNRDDPSIVVPKRFGVGWTVNCANPLAWLAVAAVVLVTVVFILMVNKAVS